MISIVACCHGAKLCAHATRDFRSQPQSKPAAQELVDAMVTVLRTGRTKSEALSGSNTRPMILHFTSVPTSCSSAWNVVNVKNR